MMDRPASAGPPLIQEPPHQSGAGMSVCVCVTRLARRFHAARLQPPPPLCRIVATRKHAVALSSPRFRLQQHFWTNSTPALAVLESALIIEAVGRRRRCRNHAGNKNK